ncbi:Hypothetical protein CINCED_3A018679 [Cinara cedri]|nr:Hypothetical protein CINCED_3A018679 [Cinara cedri]
MRGRGRGRGISKRRGPRPRQPSLTADDTDAEGTSNDGNVSFEQLPSQSTSLQGQSNAEYNEERELSLPRLKPTAIGENSTLASILSRDRKSDYIMSDDEMDHVQWELESMLTSLILHKNTVKDELSTFASMQFNRSQQKINQNPMLPKITPRAAAEISPVNECRKMKIEFDPTSKELPPNKTESANRFWSQVEPFLARVTKEDVKWLENLVKSYDLNDKLYEIPPLGEHYSKIWAKEELEMQKNQSSSSPRPNKKIKLTERITPDVIELVNRVNSALHDGIPSTPVYQRVVSALKEHAPSEDTEEHFLEFDDEDKPQEMNNTCKEFYAEQNVKKQLNKLGLLGRYSKMVPPPLPPPPPPLPPPPPPLSSQDLPSTSAIPDEDHDEILEEILKCDRELAQLRELNKNSLTKLLEKCHIDYRQQIIKKKIEVVNEKIIHFKRMQNESWTKEKQLAQANKEDEELSFLLNDRSDLLMQLQSIPFDPSSILNLSASDDSESSDEEFDSSKVIKTEKSEPDVNIKEEHDDEYQTANDFELHIKQEVIEENIVCEEVNEDINMELVIKGEMNTEEMEQMVDETNETENINEDKTNEDYRTGQKIDETASINSGRSDTLSPNYFDIANSSCLDNTNSSCLDIVTECMEPVLNCLDTATCLDTNTCLDIANSSLDTVTSDLETVTGLYSASSLDNDSCLDTANINRIDKINVEDKDNSNTYEPVINQSCIEEIQSTSGNVQTSKIELKNSIEIKTEPVEYEQELDLTENNAMIDGIKRELRPRKLNETVYFEQYIGSSSEESDFTLSD